MSGTYRIAMVGACPFPTAQGSQVLLRQLSEGLAARGHVVHVVTYHLGDALLETPERMRVHRILRVPGYCKVSSGPAWGKLILDALLLLLLVRVVRREAVDVIHAHNYEALLVSWLVGLATGRPVVYHSHNVMAAELPSYFRYSWARWLARRLGWLLDSQLPRRADACIAMSPEAAAFFQASGIGPERIHLVPPGIDEDDAPLPDAAQVRRQYELGDGPLVIYTGNLDQYQRLDLLVRSHVRVRAEEPGARLIVATHSPLAQYQRLVEQVGGMPAVRFIHCQSFAGMRALLAAADVAVCPRVACFGFPIKLLNYMAAGKAIVVAHGSAKGIRHMQNGYVAEDGAEALAEGILRLLRDPALARRLGMAARAKVESRYRWAHAVREVERCYDQVVGRAVEPQVSNDQSVMEVKL